MQSVVQLVPDLHKSFLNDLDWASLSPSSIIQGVRGNGAAQISAEWSPP